MNLAIVSEALDGKFADLALSDVERIALLKDYYRGRRSAIIGFITVAISAFKLSLSSFLGNPDLSLWLVPLFLLLAVMGLFATVWGAMKWIDTSSELKALGYANPRQALPYRNRPAIPAPVKGYTTGSMNSSARDVALPDAPASVTEHTTKSLQERREPELTPRKVSN
jgi:hypothetical protein